MRLKWKLPKVIGPGCVYVFECAQCRRLDFADGGSDDDRALVQVACEWSLGRGNNIDRPIDLQCVDHTSEEGDDPAADLAGPVRCPDARQTHQS